MCRHWAAFIKHLGWVLPCPRRVAFDGAPLVLQRSEESIVLITRTWRPKRLLQWGLGLLGIGLVAIQFVPYGHDHTNPPGHTRARLEQPGHARACRPRLLRLPQQSDRLAVVHQRGADLLVHPARCRRWAPPAQLLGVGQAAARGARCPQRGPTRRRCHPRSTCLCIRRRS